MHAELDVKIEKTFDITFTWNDGSEDRQLDWADRDQIRRLIADGFIEGELCQIDHNDVEQRGWWSRHERN